jgi:hypothetical protein
VIAIAFKKEYLVEELFLSFEVFEIVSGERIREK